MALYGNNTSRAENVHESATSTRLTVNHYLRLRSRSMCISLKIVSLTAGSKWAGPGLADKWAGPNWAKNLSDWAGP